MANTEGGRLNRSIHSQVYFNRSPKVIDLYPTSFRTTLSTETTPSQGTYYAQNLYQECVAGQSKARVTYQGGVSQEQIAVLLNPSTPQANYASESSRLAHEECPGYVRAFSDVIPPIIQCLPLPPPPAPPMDPGANPTRCR